MKNVLIIGGAGYIGTRLSNYLLSKGHKVTVVDNFWFGDYLQNDIIKIKKNLWELKSKELEGFDSVLFLAGLANDPMALFRPDLSFIENGSAPAYIAYLAKEVGIKKFIYASSCSVYGYTKNKMLNENSKIKPSYVYGISKLQSEYGITTLEDENFKPIIFRKGTVGGWSQKMRYDLVINTMLKSAITTKKIIVNNPNLWRPLIDIRDVIQGYELAINDTANTTGIFNISGVNLTIGDLGKLIKNKLNELGFSVDLIINNAQDVRNYKVSTTKIEKELKFKSKFSPIDSMLDILNNIDLNNYNFDNPAYSNIDTFKRVLLK